MLRAAFSWQGSRNSLRLFLCRQTHPKSATAARGTGKGRSSEHALHHHRGKQVAEIRHGTAKGEGDGSTHVWNLALVSPLQGSAALPLSPVEDMILYFASTLGHKGGYRIAYPRRC